MSAPDRMWLQCHEAEVGKIDWLATTMWNERQYATDQEYVRADILDRWKRSNRRLADELDMVRGELKRVQGG